uniref:(northern house mosquito) hypothetical protein n=1 Tax=Culex pipiens TaxID=7175 RepID=A0A8D8J1J4_CULPI
MAQLDISHLSRALGKSGQNHGRLSPEAAGAALWLRRDCTSGADAGGPAGRNRWPHRRQPQSVPVQNRLVGSHVYVDGSSVSGVGRSVVHHGAEGAVRVQRKSIYFDGNLQRIPSHVLSQCVDVVPAVTS